MDDLFAFFKRLFIVTTAWGAGFFVLAIGKALIDGRSLTLTITIVSAVLCWFFALFCVLIGTAIGHVRRGAKQVVREAVSRPAPREAGREARGPGHRTQGGVPSRK